MPTEKHLENALSSHAPHIVNFCRVISTVKLFSLNHAWLRVFAEKSCHLFSTHGTQHLWSDSMSESLWMYLLCEMDYLVKVM